MSSGKFIVKGLIKIGERVNERGVALGILMDITEGGGYNNIVLRRSLERYPELKREGRAFITECVNGTLRRLMTLDYIVNQVSKIHTTRMEPVIRNILRMSVYQTVYMDRVPAHAICDQAAELAAESGYGYLKGFVNAVLRNAGRRLEDILESIEDIKDEAMETYMEVKYSVPRSAAGAVAQYLGREEAEEVFRHMNDYRPLVSVCVNTTKTDASSLRKALENEGVTVEPGVLWGNALRLQGLPDITGLESFQNGLFHVMDEGAMAVVSAAGIQPGYKVLDVCAAPGGKAFLAAYLAGDVGEVLARDIHEHKVELIKEGAERLGISNLKAQEWDAEERDEACNGAYDVVLVDAPCTGLGLMGKKPDIRYNFDTRMFSTLQGLQRRILNATAGYVKPGGVLIYSTCTLTQEENERTALWVQKTLELDPEDIEGLPASVTSGATGCVRLLPHKTQTDGFFIAKFRRKS